MWSRNIFLLLALITFIPAVSGAETIMFDASIFNNDTATIDNLQIVNGSIKPMAPEGEYAVRLLDGSGETVYEDSFSLSFTIIYFRNGYGSNGSSETEKEVERRRFQIPANPRAERLQLVKGESVLYETGLVDRLCTQDANCTRYCRSGERWKMVEACSQPIERSDGGIEWLQLLGGLLLLVIAVLIVKWPPLGKKERDNPSTDQNFYSRDTD